MWQDGTFSDRVLEALIERQRSGVTVRVLLDGLGATGAPDERFEALQAAGGLVAKFRTPTFGSWTRFHRRNHRRAIVIDGATGFTGGMAVNDKWLGKAQDPDHWRDVMFKVTGPMAASLQSAFADVWAISSGEILGGAQMYPPMPPGDAAAGPPFIHLVHSPADDDQSMAYFFLTAVLGATDRIVIATPYFIPDAPLRQALEDRARAGVDVTLLLPGPYTDNAWVRLSGQSHYEPLMDAGVAIYEYQPTFMHSKIVVVDGQWSIFGSPNVNTRSRQLDEENAFAVLDSGLATTLERILADDIGHAERVDRERWRQRHWRLRMMQWFSRVLDQQS
jgi:cardiolipin synthase